MSVFLTGVARSSFKQLLIYLQEAERTLLQTYYFRENLVAPRTELETSESVTRSSDN
jgi:hypothetical protein